MKTSKKILSIVLALIMLTTMVTSVFYASACSANNHDPYKEATTVLDLIDNKLDAYDVNITGSLDGMVNSKELIQTVNNLLTEEKLNSYLYSLLESQDILKYLESGQWLIDIGNEGLSSFLKQYLAADGTIDEAAKKLLKELIIRANEGLPELFEIDARFPSYASFEEKFNSALDQYLDGEKFIAMIDKLVADLIDGKLIYDENGRKILKGMDPEWAAALDKIIEGLIGEYVNNGQKLLDLGNEKILELLNTKEVFGKPIMQLRYIDNIDDVVRQLVLSDNSEVMQMAANALRSLFPNVQPTYESIVSCLLPFLSAFNFGQLDFKNIGAALQLASPVGFAYLAGLQSPLLDEHYLDTINQNLVNFGYTGTPVEPLINLDDETAEKLLTYVAQEKDGTPLAEIAENGFDWTEYLGDADMLDIANAFIKIALGDPEKLGELAATPGLGTALVNLLCDLLNDVQAAPVSTLLKKLSNATDMAAIVDLAMKIMDGADDAYKSFDLYSQNIYYDGEGNTAFYVNKDDLTYAGPQLMTQYIPVIAAALDFLSNLSDKVDANGGDVLKTLLKDKLPQLGNVLKSVISYEDKDGKTQIGMIAYLLDDYKTYLQAQNAALCDDLLWGISQAVVNQAQEGIELANQKIERWREYLAVAQAGEEAAKLEKAKELGLMDESATQYDEGAVFAKIEQIIAQLTQDVATLEQQIALDRQALAQAQTALEEATDAYNAAEELYNYAFTDPFYTDLCAIINAQDYSLISQLEADCKEEFESLYGEGAFSILAGYLVDNMEYYGSGDDFMEDYLFGEYGFNVYGMMDDAQTAKTQAQADYNTLDQLVQDEEKQRDSMAAKIAEYESGKPLEDIQAAGDAFTFEIHDSFLPADGKFNTEKIQARIQTLEDETISGYTDTIAAEQAKQQEYKADKAQQMSIVDSYDIDGLNMEQQAMNALADAVMVFLGGDENTGSLYDYFDEGKFIEMLVAPDRVDALKSVVDTLITLFGDKIGSGGDYTTQLWEIEEILFGDDGILSTLYTDFLNDPVLSVVERVAPLKDIVDIVYDMGFLRDIIDQYKDLIDAVATLFGDKTEGFIAEWETPYDDGTANHHYVNAVLSLLPKIVEIYDDVKDIEAVQKLIGPYSDIIEFVIGLLSKDFYDQIVEDGIIETILEDENLETLQNLIINVLETLKPKNYELYETGVKIIFDQILDGLYQDLLVDPVLALTQRVPKITTLVAFAAYAFGFDIAPYTTLINDINQMFGDEFTKNWQKSKLTGIIKSVGPLTDVLNDVLDIVVNLDPATLQRLLDMLPEEIREKLPADFINVVVDTLKDLLGGVKELADNLVEDYHQSPMKTIFKRVPTLVDMLNDLLGNDDLVNLVLDLVKDIKIDDDTTIGDLEPLIRKVLSKVTDEIGPALKDGVNLDTIQLYEENQLDGVIKLGDTALSIIKSIISDDKLIDGILSLKLISSITLGDIVPEDSRAILDDLGLSPDTTIGELSGLIKMLLKLVSGVVEDVSLEKLWKDLNDKPVETVVEVLHKVADAIDQILAIDDKTVKPYIDSLKNTLELIRDILDSIQVKDSVLSTDYIDLDKPLESKLLDSDTINRIKTALNEVADFVEDLGTENANEIAKAIRSLVNIIGALDGAVDRISTQSLFKTLDELVDLIKNNKDNILPLLEDVTIGDYRLGDFFDLIDPLLALLDGIGADAEKSLVGAIAARIPLLGDLIRAIFANETVCNIEIAGYKIGDFASAADILLNILDETFGEDFLSNPLKALFDRIDYIKALYEWLKDFGLKDLLGDAVVLYGYNLLDAVDILLPVLDKQLYYDFEQSIWKALTSGARIGRIETALKSLIRFADIFSYSVNEGLCSMISGVCGVLDGLYDSLVLPTTPERGGNQLHKTSRVLVKKLPAIQRMLKSLKPLLGKDKLINLTDIISDTVKMEKDDVLKAIVGVDLVKPYYYGISDVLDVVGENAANYDWNTFAGIIDALNGVGKELVPALEKALGVSDVEWKDLILPTPEYKAGGTAEDYLVEISGELGEGILTQLVGTLLKAALTIPAIKDMIGDVDAEAVAGLLNDLLEFDFLDNKVEFDAFNTEHLILTGLNLLLPKTAPAPSPATADEVVMIIAVIGTTAAAGTGIFFTLKKRREEMDVNA